MNGIVYVSSALVPFDDNAVADLAAHAAARNEQLGVTGYLCFEDNRAIRDATEFGDIGYGRFLQYIEGEKTTLRGLMARIRADARHKVLQECTDDWFEHRRFPSWSMRWIRRSSFAGVEQLLSRYLIFMEKGWGEEKRIIELIDLMAKYQAQIAAFEGENPYLQRRRSSNREQSE